MGRQACLIHCASRLHWEDRAARSLPAPLAAPLPERLDHGQRHPSSAAGQSTRGRPGIDWRPRHRTDATSRLDSGGAGRRGGRRQARWTQAWRHGAGPDRGRRRGRRECATRRPRRRFQQGDPRQAERRTSGGTRAHDRQACGPAENILARPAHVPPDHGWLCQRPPDRRGPHALDTGGSARARARMGHGDGRPRRRGHRLALASRRRHPERRLDPLPARPASSPARPTAAPSRPCACVSIRPVASWLAKSSISSGTRR